MARAFVLVVVATLAASCSTGPASTEAPDREESPVLSLSAMPSPSQSASAGPGSIADLAGAGPSRTLFVTADDVAIRTAPAADAEILARVNAGQTMGLLDGRDEADGLRWYEVRLGPGTLTGWITNGPEHAWLRLLSDGDIAYACEDCDAVAGVYVTDQPGETGTRLADALVDWAWSPDGTRIAGTYQPNDGTPSTIVVMGPDGSDRRELGLGYAPAWSPDGSRLAWSGDEITLTDADLEPSVVDVPSRGAGQVQWSPDARRLAWTAIDCRECPAGPIMGDPPSALWVAGLDGGDARQLTGGDYSGLADWAPDGSLLGVILHDLSGQFPMRAYTISPEGGSRTFLNGGGEVLTPPKWSPDGTRMAFVTADGLMLADGDGSDARLIVPAGETGIWEHAWSPSGSMILFGTGSSPSLDGLDLWVVAADQGTEPVRLTPAERTARQATWQPILVELP